MISSLLPLWEKVASEAPDEGSLSERRGCIRGDNPSPVRALRCVHPLPQGEREDVDPHTFRFIHTAFGSVKFSIAAEPCSRPKPESRTPPHGNRTSV